MTDIPCALRPMWDVEREEQSSCGLELCGDGRTIIPSALVLRQGDVRTRDLVTRVYSRECLERALKMRTSPREVALGKRENSSRPLGGADPIGEPGGRGQ